MRRAAVRLLACALLAAPEVALGQSAGGFTFRADEVAPSRFEFGGFLEGRSDWTAYDNDSPFRRLAHPRGAPASGWRAEPGLELRGTFREGPFRLFAAGNLNYLGDTAAAGRGAATLYEGYGLYEWAPGSAFALGKRVLRWGKGYAFSPTGFVERPRDPTDPEAAREGYWMATAEWTRSFSEAGPLQTLGLTAVLLPVVPNVNYEYGGPRGINAAGRLSLLVADTDIDFVLAGGDTRGLRLGGSIARNLLPELVVYGEAAWFAEEPRLPVDAPGRPVPPAEKNAMSAVLGLRWQAPTDTTLILEYYRNGLGVTAEQFAHVVEILDRAAEQQAATGSDALVAPARRLARAYQRPQPLRDYVYLRLSQREPWNILHTTPAITVIADPSGQSASVTPEVVYTGFRNTELRLRAQMNLGPRDSDFGARQVNARLELRARLFF
jgi:hypothetical protein